METQIKSGITYSNQLLRHRFVQDFLHRQGDDDLVKANPGARIFKGKVAQAGRLRYFGKCRGATMEISQTRSVWI